MKKQLFILSLLICLLSISFSLETNQNNQEEEEVVELYDHNIQTVIQYNDYVLLEFYAPWCGHCKKLAPEYSQAAKELKKAGSSVLLAKIDGTQNKDSATEYKIEQFPTIFFIEKSKSIIYSGGNTASDIVKWIQKRTGQQVLHIETAEELEQFREFNKVGVVLFGENSGEKWNLYDSISIEQKKLNFAVITSEELRQQQQVSQNQIVIYKQFGEGKNVYSGPFQKEDIIKFINQSQLDVVMEFDDIAVQAIFMRKNPAIFFFHDNSVESNDQLEIFKELAAQNQDKGLIFTVTSPTDGHRQWDQLAGYLKIDNKQAPFVYFVHMTPREVKKEKLEGRVNAESLQNFINKHQQENKKTDL